MEAIGQLAGGVANDFNNLLGVIVGCGELLLKAMGPAAPGRERAEQILHAATRGAALTRQLLAFSRHQPMETRVFELAAAVSTTEAMLRRLIGENIEVATFSDGLLGRVKADPAQIEQVVMNLALNARDAMPGGGRLVLETSNVDLDADYARSHPDVEPGSYVLLSVTDNGVGMGAETLSHIFEPFYTTKEPGRGTGLGLATVYGIVGQSGGHLAVYSEPGRGTSVKVYLPRVQDAVERAAASSEGGPGKGSETVLLVEDEEALRDVIHDQLVEGGYQVILSQDAAAALRAAEVHPAPIHLLITDIVMPQMGGPEVVARVRALRPGIRALYLSGYSSASAGAHGLVEVDQPFLQKPFTLDALLRKVRQVLDGPAPEGR
jgi:CheY-like chemotaxis protein